MTAEIAILNKLAVALATDSAVTISAGDQQQKTYDSADKLFHLSHHNPIGIMIFNGMQFMQAPLPMIISEYRSQCRPFSTVRDAATNFLEYLNAWGQNSPDHVARAAVEAIVSPTLTRLNERINKKIEQAVSNSDLGPNLIERIKDIHSEEIAVFERLFDSMPKSKFIGGTMRMTKARKAVIREIATSYSALIVNNDRITALAESVLRSESPSGNHTGIVIAGFGGSEIFPTLISFNIDGIVFGSLKYAETNFVDIDRAGDRARVIPFAQKEMVDRFLYGLDERIERQIATFCKNTVPEISTLILDQLEMPDEDKAELKAKAEKAESVFISNLKQKQFENIRLQSQSEIEGMVEFMPKPELARMAEALVNLTSLKRRVSRGMDTVGGPIDVAVISRSEGFVWIKRKHYFSQELNPRYIAGIRKSAEEMSNGHDH